MWALLPGGPAGSAVTPPPPSPQGDRADSAASPRGWGRQALSRWPPDRGTLAAVCVCHAASQSRRELSG